MKVVDSIQFNRGSWATHTNTEWEGFYLFEAVLDWSYYKGCKGELWVESMDFENPPEGGWLRLAYQYKPAEFIPVIGSEIKTRNTVGNRWTLQKSEAFDLPQTGDVACLWIQGKAEKGKNISIALATLVILEDD